MPLNGLARDLRVLPDRVEEILERAKALGWAVRTEKDRWVLARDPESIRHRVVVVLDAPDGSVEDEDGLETGAVELTAELPVARIVSALIDDAPAEPVVVRVLANPDSKAANSRLAADSAGGRPGTSLAENIRVCPRPTANCAG